MIWQVGSSRTYTAPSQVSSLVQNSDTVEIDAGVYPSNVCRWLADSLVLRAVGGFAQLQANGLTYGDKGIWVVDGSHTTIEWIEFTGAVSTSHNGAGIRLEASDLTVRHCYFHNNEDGILTGVYPGKVTIEFSEFGYNGYGDGFSHNLYIGHTDTLLFRFNYSHHCNVGHELKSRAAVNIIYCNRISNEVTGNASREIDLPNGGLAIISGNIIEQGPNSQNSNIIGYGLEGLSNPGPQEFYLVNNTMINDRASGTFVQIQNGTSLYKGRNNIFAGNATLLSGMATTLDTASDLYSAQVSTFFFVDPANYDYHLISFSPAIDAGVNPGLTNGGIQLFPMQEYVHPADSGLRVVDVTPDIGAFEYPTTITGAHEIREQQEPRIYQTSQTVRISARGSIGRIRILDLSGRCCFDRLIGSDEISISTGAIFPGIYLIELENYSGIYFHEKVFISGL